MNRLINIFLLCYTIDILLFYLPEFLADRVFGENYIMLFGVWGMKMDFFYDFGFIFLFFIVGINVLMLKFNDSSSRKVRWYEWMGICILIYIFFISLSTFVISLYLNLKDGPLYLKEFSKDLGRIFCDSVVVGLLLIIFSPITYLILLNHYFIIRRFKCCP